MVIKKYPNWFSPHSKPTFHGLIPVKVYYVDKIVDTIKFTSGEELHPESFDPNKTYKIGSIYEGGQYDDSYVNIEEIKNIEVENTSYSKQLKEYEAQKKQYEENSNAWPDLKNKWDEEQKIKTEIEERRLFEKLSKKFKNKP